MGRSAFHILEVKKEKGTFREVEGEGVEVLGLSMFVHNRGDSVRPDWIVSDVISGVRTGGPSGTKAEAITDAYVRLLKCGVQHFVDKLRQSMVDDHGMSPSVGFKVEVIQEPQQKCEFETCSRETHCGHH